MGFIWDLNVYWMEVPLRVNSEKPWCSTTLGTRSTFLGGYDPPVGGKRKHPYKPMMSCQSSMIISLVHFILFLFLGLWWSLLMSWHVGGSIPVDCANPVSFPVKIMSFLTRWSQTHVRISTAHQQMNILCSSCSYDHKETMWNPETIIHFSLWSINFFWSEGLINVLWEWRILFFSWTIGNRSQPLWM